MAKLTTRRDEDSKLKLGTSKLQTITFGEMLEHLKVPKEVSDEILTKKQSPSVRLSTKKLIANVKWELFFDNAFYDMWAVRPAGDTDFDSPRLFHFNTWNDALEFTRLIGNCYCAVPGKRLKKHLKDSKKTLNR